MSTDVESFTEQGLLPIKGLLLDKNVNEIVINPNGSIFAEYVDAVHMQPVNNIKMSEHDIHSLGSNLAGEAGHALGDDHPIVSGRVFVFGSDVRVQVVIPPAIEKGVSLSIRKYISRILKPTEIKFILGKHVNIDEERKATQKVIQALVAKSELDKLFRKAINDRMNILISGGTSSGKTTIARALLAMSHKDERLVTIEDAVELRPEHRNVVALVASRREGSDRSTAKLLESSLRMRPDRLIVGELRGAEAYNFLEAINTGHPGSISTIHADSPKLALERIALMVMQTGVRLNRNDIIEYAKQTIDLIIQVGRRDGKRGVLEVFLP